MTDDKLLSGLSIDRGLAPSSGSGNKALILMTLLFLAASGVALWSITREGNALAGSAVVPASAPAAAAPAPAAASASALASQPSPPAAAQRDARILDASGYVVAMRIATASSRTVGRVEEVLVEEGMKVEKGQVLARLDSSSLLIQLDLTRAKLQRAEALYRESESRLKEAQLALNRTEGLYADRLISDELMDNAGIRVELMNAELDRQAADIEIVRQEIRLLQQQIEDNTIRAPFSGVVVQKNAQPGEIISPSSSGGGFTRTGICTIVDMSSLEIEVNVNESYINRVSVGQRAEAILDAYPALVIPAEVSAIVPTADRQRATIKVRVRFQELDPRILPDMGVKVAFFEI